jgi:GTPase SAR1 family protein
MQKVFNILVLGDARVGKTTLINQFLNKKYEEEYNPSIKMNIVYPSVQSK